MRLTHALVLLSLLVTSTQARAANEPPPLPDLLHLSFEHQPSGAALEWTVESPKPGPQARKRIDLPEGGAFEVDIVLEPLQETAGGAMTTVVFQVVEVTKKRKKEKRQLVMAPVIAALVGQPARVMQGSSDGYSIALTARYEPWAGTVFADGEQVIACRVDGTIRDGFDCPVGRVRTVGPVPPEAGMVSVPTGTGSVWVDPRSAEPCPDNRSLKVDETGGGVVGGAIEEFPTDHARYRPLIGEALGIPDIQLGQLLRVDLENDGVDEVLFAADSHGGERPMTDSSGSAVYETYSIIGLRKVVQGSEVATVVVWEYRGTVDWEKGFPELAAATLSGFTDIDGDGTLEIVVSSSGYEWWDTALYRVEGTEAVRLAGAGCAI